MSILLLLIHATGKTNWGYDIPLFMLLFDLDLLVLMRAIQLIRQWR